MIHWLRKGRRGRSRFTHAHIAGVVARSGRLGRIKSVDLAYNDRSQAGMFRELTASQSSPWTRFFPAGVSGVW